MVFAGRVSILRVSGKADVVCSPPQRICSRFRCHPSRCSNSSTLLLARLDPLGPRIFGFFRFCGKFFSKSKGVHGMFQRPLAEFMSRKVISLVVSYGGGLMCVNRKIVQF